MSEIELTEYEPYDGDYIEADYTGLINAIQTEAGYALGACREICVSLTGDDLIEILFSNDKGTEWEDRHHYPIPDGWTIDQLRPMFAGYPVYLKTDEYQATDDDDDDDDDDDLDTDD